MRKKGLKVFSAFLALVFALAPTAVLAQQRQQFGNNNPIRNIPITGTVTGTEQNGASFVGTFDIERFEAVGDQLLAVGSLSGKVGNTPVNHAAAAIPVTSVTTTNPESAVDRPLKAVPASLDRSEARPLVVIPAVTCPVLHLTLGPINLNLLGLVVTTNQIVINIDAVTGPSNLLGNLLCGLLGGLSNLLGGGAALAQIAAALSDLANALNGLLGGL